ncbi:hypothetical protein Nepgr_006416 [Nepenthes gracilis]|uniref:Non-haem dioxygenase N-terminal domain-containing protein n=1 Tax=Nepenthes gracilis TaxID=150966 RepID=A0AAD3XHK3_NEPGR|nr:hypothetical protein Nepgr_006416 [Nepenthes gracilis]
MAASFEAELPSKPVQEIAQSTKEVPERFIHKNGFPQDIHDSVPLMDTLLIDLSFISTEAELQKLQFALTSWGCFQVINHGMTSSFLDENTRLLIGPIDCILLFIQKINASLTFGQITFQNSGKLYLNT